VTLTAKTSGKATTMVKLIFASNVENEAKVMRERVIVHDQLKAFTLHLEGKPDLSAAYHEFLVSI